MILRFAISAALMLAATPVFAGSLRDTHTEMHMPAGKLPSKLYRPIARDDCATVQAHRQSGKLPIAPLATGAGDDRCRTRIVERDEQPRG